MAHDNLSYKDKIDLINTYVDQEDVFNYCGFDTSKRKLTNPYRPDKHPDCYFKWYRNVLFFYDWGTTFPGETKNENGITIYGAVKLFKGMPLGKDTNKWAIDFIIERFVWGVADSMNEERAKQLQLKRKAKSVEDVIEVEYKKQTLGHGNYYDQFGLNPQVLKKEFVFKCRDYTIYKNGKDITGAFPTQEEAFNNIIVYQYGDTAKFYAPHIKKGLKKPRFWGNINATNTIEGADQLKNPKHKSMTLKGSKKDYMVGRYALKLNTDVFATQNEGSYLPDWFLNKIKLIYPKRLVLFDADRAGYEKGFRVMQHDEFTGQLLLPQYYNDKNELLDDTSNLFVHYGKKMTIDIIKSSTLIPYDKDYKQDHAADLASTFPDT